MLPTIDLHFISHELARLGEELQRAGDERPGAVPTGARLLLDALNDLIATLNDTQADTPAACAQALRAATGSTPDALLAHGLDLLAQVAGEAARLGLLHQAADLAGLSLPLTCWMLRRGAELTHPELVVDAAAGLANALEEPDELAALYALMVELAEGMSPSYTLEPGDDPNHPWRVLLLNRAIVATRSQRPALMADAFDALGDQLPADAPDFFRAGLAEMESPDYAPPVRETMQRYYDRWCAGQRLH